MIVETIPEEILLAILGNLQSHHLSRLSLTNQYFRDLISAAENDALLWKKFFLVTSLEQLSALKWPRRSTAMILSLPETPPSFRQTFQIVYGVCKYAMRTLRNEYANWQVLLRDAIQQLISSIYGIWQAEAKHFESKFRKFEVILVNLPIGTKFDPLAVGAKILLCIDGVIEALKVVNSTPEFSSNLLQICASKWRGGEEGMWNGHSDAAWTLRRLCRRFKHVKNLLTRAAEIVKTKY